MSKLYFTKYLPIEGEIKEDDTTFRMGKVQKANLNFPKDYQQKVKLFLCSRDIQVGDEYTYEESKGKLLKKEGNTITTEWLEGFNKGKKSTDHIVMFNHAFKVIGEVSKDALTYVTEEMEFEENEIKISQNAKFKYNWKDFPFEGKNRTDLRKQTIYPHSPSFSNSTWEILNPLPEHILIKIKGQCGHFH